MTDCGRNSARSRERQAPGPPDGLAEPPVDDQGPSHTPSVLPALSPSVGSGLLAAEGSPRVSGSLLISSHTVTSQIKSVMLGRKLVTASRRIWTNTIGPCILSTHPQPNQRQLSEEGAKAGALRAPPAGQ